MASPRAIAGVLAYLHELYPTREIGVETTEAWAMTFAAWDDATLTSCARAVAATPGRTFFPTPGELAAARPVPLVDGDGVLRQIEKLSRYSPHAGMIPPRIGEVEEALGYEIAAAYAFAGGPRLFSDNEVTRDIARRQFQEDLQDTVAHADVEIRHRLAASSLGRSPLGAAATPATPATLQLAAGFPE